MTIFKMIFFFAAGALLCGLTGCGTPDVKLVPTAGTLTINGKPAEGVMVQFMPKVVDETVKAPTSQAITVEGGKFELVTMDNKVGAVLGPHRVSLFDTLEERVPQGAKASKPPRLHPKYSSGAIEATVVEGESIAIEVTGPGK